MEWWGWFTLTNAFLCILWAVAMARHYKALVFLQKGIAACALVALLEASASYLQYRAWNVTGTESALLEGATMFSYSIKYVLTLRMLLETAAGAGVTVEKLDTPVTLKMDAVCMLFLLLQWLWKIIMANKDRLMLPSKFLLVITIPGTLLWACVFLWVYRKFHQQLSQMKDRKLGSEVVDLFINVRMVLVGSILLATVVLMIQVADIVVSETPWNLQWLPYDGSPHTVYTLFLLALMILWWPNADSWKLGYSDSVIQEENETGGDGQVQAEQVGVAEAEQV